MMDLDRLRELLAKYEHPSPWHSGRTVGRTIYDGDGSDDMIGVMDNRELAELVVLAVTYCGEHI